MNTRVDVIIKPIFTENSIKDAALGKFTFLVKSDVNKNQIKNAIEELYKVNVISVATNITKGSKTHVTKKGRTVRDFENKKARVTLKKGQKIEIFEDKKE
jgi:large subunit ribosomal protein L23